MTFKLHHLLLALSLHAAVFLLLTGGVQCTRKVQAPPVIEAVLYDPSRKETLEQKRKTDQAQKELEKTRKEALEKKRKDDDLEKKRVADLEIKKRKADELKTQKEFAQKKKAEDLARVKKEKDEKLEQERQELRAAETKEQMQRELEQEALRRQMDQEAQGRKDAEMNAKRGEWAVLLTRHIKRNWTRPSDNSGDFSCTVQVKLLPDGTVTYAKIVKSCGNPVLNKSVEDAIFRASPVPRPNDPAVFERDLTINFNPGR